jgi:ATP-binding cassette subfamily B protein
MESIITVKIAAAENDILKLFMSKSNSELPQSTLIWNSFLLALFSAIPFAVFPLIVSVGFWYSGYVYVGSGMSLSDVIQASYAIGDAGEVVSYIISQLPEYFRYKWEAIKVFDLLDNDMSFDRGEKISFDQPPESSPGMLVSISFSHVTFSYKSAVDSPAIRDVSLTARRGETVTIFGPFQSGKSTILNLILRYYDPQYGRICLNDCMGIREVKILFLRSLISLVPQSPVIFENLSLVENILYSLPDTDIETPMVIQKVLALLDLGDESFVNEFRSLEVLFETRNYFF